jgi:hypothetical protein
MATASARGFDGQHLGREGMACNAAAKNARSAMGQKTGEAIGAYLVFIKIWSDMSRQSRFRTYFKDTATSAGTARFM